jgi:hypothetical protein
MLGHGLPGVEEVGVRVGLGELPDDLDRLRPQDDLA